MRKQFLVFVSLCFWGPVLQAQENIPTTPLHLYLQTNFDSTIVLHSFSAWDGKPNYQIITKFNGRINTFTYQFPYPTLIGGAMPKQLADKFLFRKFTFQSIPPDTNAYFIPYMFRRKINEQQLNKSLDSLQLWTMRDDKSDGYGCPAKSCDIYDSGEYHVWLITKSEIKKLGFYDPYYYESCCPGRKGRLTFIAFYKLMSTIFN